MYRVVSFVSQNIPSDKQRLIFKGKVLQDDKKLSEYGNYIFFITCTVIQMCMQGTI